MWRLERDSVYYSDDNEYMAVSGRPTDAGAFRILVGGKLDLIWDKDRGLWECSKADMYEFTVDESPHAAIAQAELARPETVNVGGHAMSYHAVQRWHERFSGLDIDEVFAGSRRPGKKTKKRIIENQAPVSGKHMIAEKRYYLVNFWRRTVFVVASDTQEIITVFPLQGADK